MLMSLAGCSNDDFLDGTQAGGGSEVGTKGDLFMTMNISMASQLGTRTSTPNQGYEIGKDEENKISSALIILAKSDGAPYGQEKFTIMFTSETGTNLQNTVTDSGHEGTVDNAPEQPEEGTPDGIGNYLEPDPAHQGRYTAKFLFDRGSLKEALETPVSEEDGTHNTEGNKKGEFVIFMVANPTPAIRAAAQPDNDLQTVIEAAANPATSFGSVAPNSELFWQDNYFTMSSAWAVKKVIYADEIADGTHIKKEDPYKLGTVTVQRVMSRFDLAVTGNHLNFLGEGNNETTANGTGPGLSQVKVEFDAVAMVNMAKKAYLYKVMSLDATSLTTWNNGEGKPTKFGDERDADYVDWWTFTPKQTEYFSPLFDGVAGKSLSELQAANLTVQANDMESFFAEGADFQLITTVQKNKEDNTFDFKGESGHENGTGDYRIWRYAMENANADNIANQVNGNSTGVIFRAKLTEQYPTEQADIEKYGERRIPTEYLENDSDNDGQKIYAYNNVILGTAQQLFDYATKNKKDANDPIWDDVNRIYWSIIQAKYNDNWDNDKNGQGNGGYTDTEEDDWWIQVKDQQEELKPGQIAPGGVLETVYHHGDLEGDEGIEAELVKAGFTIYTPTNVNNKPVYYCYYIYWNRHNDNGQNTIMGRMEFASVRNNVYKLSVNKVLRLGHPGETGNDPYPPKPGTPDEEDEFWLEVECNILPWEVRINNIEF